MFDQKYEHDAAHVQEPLSRFSSSMNDRGLEHIHGLEATVSLVANLLTTAAIFSLVSSTCLVMYLVQKLLEHRARASLDTRLQLMAKGDFGDTKRGRATCAIGTAFLLHVAACGLATMYLTIWTPFAEDLNAAGDREWLVMRTLYYSEAAVAAGDGASEAARLKLLRDVEAIRNVRGRLYFGLDHRTGMSTSRPGSAVSSSWSWAAVAVSVALLYGEVC